MTLGGAAVDPGRLARAVASPRLRIEPFVDQWRVLGQSDVFLTHQGLGSTHEAIHHGVPMLSYPFFWDQPGLAARAQALGVALPLVKRPRASVDAATVTAALAEVWSRREPLRVALDQARGWEEAVIAQRPAALRRIEAVM
jgi:UDP:flavonoid glycosyltransferase YjiC (YdhE family)